MEPDDPDSTQRFSDRASDYARYRPSYPAEAVDALLEGLGSLAGKVAADVGAGTGIMAHLLAARGLRVVAVEPNAAMRAAAMPDPRISWLPGTATATGLGTAAVDLLVVAQAFHWFDPPPTLREFARALRPGGRLAIVWNHRSRDDAFTLGYRHALEAIDGEAPAERSSFDPTVVAASGRFCGYRKVEVRYAQPVDLEALIGRARSTSTVPKSGPRWDQLLHLLTALHARYADAAGLASFVYRTDVHLWTAG